MEEVRCKSVLDAACSVLHPQRKHIKAFKAGYWDGRVRLYAGRVFHAGLVQAVVEELSAYRIEARVLTRSEAVLLTPYPSWRTADGRTLYPHQQDAVRAMLEHPRGHIESVTGSGKTLMMLAAANAFWNAHRWRTLLVVPLRTLLRQTLKVARAAYPDLRVGCVGDERAKIGQLTIAIPNSLSTPTGKEALRRSQVLILDECHGASSPMWHEATLDSLAFRRYGLSGTPVQERVLADMKMIAATGPCLLRVSADDLAKRRLVAVPIIAMMEIGGGVESGDEDYATAYADMIAREDYNRAIADCVEWLLKRRKRVLVLTERIDHLALLADILYERNVDHVVVHGSLNRDGHIEAQRSFEKGHVRVAIATRVWNVGKDVAGVDTIVLAEGGSGVTKTVQRIGRGMRPDSADVWVVDFKPKWSKFLARHAKRRVEIYRSRGYEVRVAVWKSARSLPFEQTVSKRVEKPSLS